MSDHAPRRRPCRSAGLAGQRVARSSGRVPSVANPVWLASVWSGCEPCGVAADEHHALLAEQVGYYRARAAEYDRWFFRQGRYDRGEETTRAWFAELDQVRHALSDVALDGADVLELAPGTGLWTELLCRRAAHVTAVDASAEMIDQNRRRLDHLTSKVHFEQADLFDWQPGAPFDAVVFCFWISHIPDRRLDAFLSMVASALRPGGSIFFVDSCRETNSTASDHTLPQPGEETMIRHLDDGRTFRIIKNFWTAETLKARCALAGLDVAVTETPTYFQYGSGRRRV